MNTATLNGQQVEYAQSNRSASPVMNDGTGPVVATLTVSIELDRDDLVAALYLWDGMDPAEMTGDDDFVRSLIVEAAVNVGLAELATRRAEMLDPPTHLASPEWIAARADWITFCRTRVAELFPTLPARRRQVRRTVKPVTARTLVNS